MFTGAIQTKGVTRLRNLEQSGSCLEGSRDGSAVYASSFSGRTGFQCFKAPLPLTGTHSEATPKGGGAARALPPSGGPPEEAEL